MKYLFVIMLIIATPLIMASQFDGKWQVCDWKNLTGSSCDDWWSANSFTSSGTYTILTNYSFNENQFRQSLQNHSINYTKFSVDKLIKNISKMVSMNETRIKEIIANTTFKLNVTSITNTANIEAVRLIDDSLKDNGKITKAINDKFDTFQNKIPTLTIINSILLLILIVGLALVIAKNRKRDEFPTPKDFKPTDLPSVKLR